MPGGRKLELQRVNPLWLFNRLQTLGGMLLVDTRGADMFCAASIRYAINIPRPEDLDQLADATVQTLEDSAVAAGAARAAKKRAAAAAASAAAGSPDAGSDDAGDEPPAAPARPPFARRKLVEIIIFDDDGLCEEAWSSRVCALVLQEGQASVVRYLEGGFAAFAAAYPFLAAECALDQAPLLSTTSGHHTVTYPNEVLEGKLYFGNRWQATQKTVVRQLGITHVVNASQDTENKFGKSLGIQYHDIRVPDKPGEDITPFLQPSHTFIEEAIAGGGRVLVHCTQGVSRSGIVVLHHVMRAQGWGLARAWAFVAARRRLMYPNLAFMKQLWALETEIVGRHSLEEGEIEPMMEGVAPGGGGQAAGAADAADTAPCGRRGWRKWGCAIC
eukprot:g3660.t1